MLHTRCPTRWPEIEIRSLIRLQGTQAATSAARSFHGDGLVNTLAEQELYGRALALLASEAKAAWRREGFGVDWSPETPAPAML